MIVPLSQSLRNSVEVPLAAIPNGVCAVKQARVRRSIVSVCHVVAQCSRARFVKYRVRARVSSETIPVRDFEEVFDAHWHCKSKVKLQCPKV